MRLLNDVDAIELFYDKAVCHAFMERNGFPVPRGLGPVRSFAELASAMKEARIGRAFVKERHGSGAAGTGGACAVAQRACGRGRRPSWSGTRTAPGSTTPSACAQYDGAEAVALIDAICALDGSVWALTPSNGRPRPSVDDHVCDLRVLVIAGEPAHTVLRMSRSADHQPGFAQSPGVRRSCCGQSSRPPSGRR